MDPLESQSMQKRMRVLLWDDSSSYDSKFMYKKRYWTNRVKNVAADSL